MPGAPIPPGPAASPNAGGPADRPDAPRPAVPPADPPAGAGPPTGHPWPGYGMPAWPPAGYPPPYAYPGAPPRRTSGGRVAGVVVAVVTVVALVFCGCVGLGLVASRYGDPGPVEEPYGQPYGEPYGEPAEGATDDPATADPGPSPATTPSSGPGRFKVVYEVTGTGPTNIQFYDANGDFLLVEAKPPWRLTFTANDRKRIQIVALPLDQRTDQVGCRISVDGTVVSRDSSFSGAIATCFGW